MTKSEIQAEALANATQNNSLTNYPAIYEGFAAMGIAEEDIKPRENVFTYNAWKALGRQVMKGQHGVRVVTWIHKGEKKDAAGNVVQRGARFPRTTTVFHVSQTTPVIVTGENGEMYGRLRDGGATPKANELAESVKDSFAWTAAE
jgi:antirestriction protein ArdC